MNTRPRNRGIDLLKYVCAFLVVCIHMAYPGKVWLEPLSRFAVPIFFMITGFFYADTCRRGKEDAQIRKILKLTLLANGLFLVWSALWSAVSSEGSFTSLFSAKVWLDFLLLNDSPFSGHLWYLGALLYVLVLIRLFEKKWDRRMLYPLIPLLLAANLLLGTYARSLFGVELPRVYSRNFLLAGLPFFLLGDLLRSHSKAYSVPLLLAWIALSALGTSLENFLLLQTDLLVNKDLFLSTPALAVALFLLVIRCAPFFDRPILTRVCHFVAPLSVYIYIFHPILDALTHKGVKILGTFLPAIPELYKLCSPIVVFTVCTAFAWLADKCKGRKA